ncbi:MAG TPA: cutinase family protein [Candidatus Saccharimonadales bacterium]|nr:cutinase family protein [Candidatus Saccharimonadales bacterium]
MLGGSAVATVVPATPAQAASPDCQNGGYYFIFARGSTAKLGSGDQKSFVGHLKYLLPNSDWAELGNINRDRGTGEDPTDPWTEHPAVAFTNVSPSYGQSVQIGKDELVNHLNWRYKSQSQGGKGCDKETVVIGGYSQGADVVGWALEGGLSAEAQNHIGYVALYGDPRFNRLCGADRWWEMAPSTQTCGSLFGGILGPRDPYAPNWIQGRFGSWCDKGDGFCNHSPDYGNHTSVYESYWYWQSAHILASFAVKKRNLLNPDKPAAVLGAYTDNLSATGPQAPSGPPPTLSKTSGVTIWPSSSTAVYQPLKFSFTVQNTSGAGASIARLEVAVRDPGGNAQDVPCAGGEGLTLAANQTFTCDARLPQGYGSTGTYTYWADWMDYAGVWHHGQLGANQSFTLGAANTLSVANPVSVGPSASATTYAPLNWSYRVRNTSGSAASIQKFAVAVRDPGGNNQDVTCANGTGVSLQPNDEWTCSATLPQGFGSTGNYTFWADWQDYANVWHHGQLGWDNTLTLGAAPTLTTTGSLSVGPSGSLGMFQPAYWSYRVKNTSGFATSIKKLIVAVRTPGGGNMDVTCNNGAGVTLPPGGEWTCEAYNYNGYGSTGSFQFWADWQGYDNAWHTGALSGTLTFNVGPPLALANDQFITLSPGNSVATGTGLTFTYRVRNMTQGGLSIQKFVVAVRDPNGNAIDVPCASGNGVALASNALFTCTATVPSGYATAGHYGYWADWQDYAGVWHPTMLSPSLDLYVF